MGFPILVRYHLYIESGPSTHLRPIVNKIKVIISIFLSLFLVHVQHKKIKHPFSVITMLFTKSQFIAFVCVQSKIFDFTPHLFSNYIFPATNCNSHWQDMYTGIPQWSAAFLFWPTVTLVPFAAWGSASLNILEVINWYLSERTHYW